MENEPGIAICFALAEEVGAFTAACGERVPTFLTGIGRQNAERAARAFLAGRRPGLLLTCGFAGGLNPELQIGDVVFEIPASAGTDHAYAVIRGKLEAAGAKEAKIYCADKIATTAADKKRLRDETGADAAEMESGSVQAVCGGLSIPCVTVRVVSDTATQDLPLDFNNYLKEDKSLDMSKLMLAVAKAPWKMGALMELQKNTKVAAQRLADVLAKAIA